MPERLLIIGYGNPLRGDDGFGWRAAERLEAEALPGATVIACHQLTPELAVAVSAADQTVFIDAACEGAPGTVTTRTVPPRAAEAHAFSHQLDPAGLLAMAQTLYGRAPQAELVTVTGARFDFGEELSESVQQAVEQVVQLVRAL